jgi:hypothetical protein
MFIILSKRLVWFYVFPYIKYSFKARCSIEFAGGVNKTYYSVRQISRIQYKLTVYCVRWNNIPRSDVQLVGCCLVLLYRLAQYITNTVRFGFAKFRLANFEFTCKGTDLCSLGPPVAAGEPGSLQPAVAACSCHIDRGYLLQYNLIYSSRMYIVLKKGPEYRYPLYFENLYSWHSCYLYILDRPGDCGYD